MNQDAEYIHKLSLYLRVKAETFSKVKLDWVTKKDEWRYRFHTIEDGEKLLKMLDALDECDDVQNVFGNFELPESLLQKLKND